MQNIIYFILYIVIKFTRDIVIAFFISFDIFKKITNSSYKLNER